MDWPEILKYKPIIEKIAKKYSGDADLAEDVVSETILKLFEDKKLDSSKFDPAKKDSAIRNTIRNKIIKILRSRKVGRWTLESLDQLLENGLQIGENRSFDAKVVVRPDMDGLYPNQDQERGDSASSYEK